MKMLTTQELQRRTFTSIAAFREATGMSQRALAGKLGITQSALSMIEHGDRMPRPELAQKIKDVCHVPTHILVSQRVRVRRQRRRK